jgi:hypothetical protein
MPCFLRKTFSLGAPRLWLTYFEFEKADKLFTIGQNY